MILIDIYVPILDRVYDFYLNPHKSVEQLINEIVKLIARQEEADLCGEKKEFLLCEIENKVILHDGYSLAEQGIEEGARLLLV